MKRTFFLWLFIIAAIVTNGQGKTLYTVNMVTPKAGQREAFETFWKGHLAKFHTTEDKRNVYQIMSGPNNGAYMIVEGPISYADMDMEKANAKEHAMDLDKNFNPKLEDNKMNGTYRFDDTASINPNVKADKFIVNVTHVKSALLTETIRESRRGAMITSKLDTFKRFSSNVYTQIWAGSNPVRVSIRNLKDGFKELESNYFGPNTNPNGFRDAYIKEYGFDAWEARSKLLDNNANIESRETYIMKLRRDLSSPQ